MEQYLLIRMVKLNRPPNLFPILIQKYFILPKTAALRVLKNKMALKAKLLDLFSFRLIALRIVIFANIENLG